MAFRSGPLPWSISPAFRAISLIDEITGGIFVFRTVTSNVRLKVALSPVVSRSPSSPPSTTVTVIVEVPCRSGLGVNFSMPVDPDSS